MAFFGGKKPGKNSRLVQKTVEYSQLGEYKDLFAFICPKFNPVLDFSPQGPVRRPFSFQGINI